MLPACPRMVPSSSSGTEPALSALTPVLSPPQRPHRLVKNRAILSHRLINEFVLLHSDLDQVPQGPGLREIGAFLPVLGNASRLHSPRPITHVKHPILFITLTPDDGMSPLVGMVIILRNTIHLELLEKGGPFPADIRGIALYPRSPGWPVITDKLSGHIHPVTEDPSQPLRLGRDVRRMPRVHSHEAQVIAKIDGKIRALGLPGKRL